jgi:formylglycine-generating enzyme required for sulfatase activity
MVRPMTEPTREKEPAAPSTKRGRALFGSTGGDAPAGPRRGLVVVVLAILGGVVYATRSMWSSPPPAPSAAPLPPPPEPVPVAEGAAVKIEGGALQMGSSDGDKDEQPVHEVRVPTFEIDTTEVTVSAYAKCVDAGKCTPPDAGPDCNWQRADLARHPVNCVDARQAEAYCTFAGRRLPTEEEWEHAARGSEGRRYPWKDGEPAANLCWNGEGNDRGKGGRRGTCPVASYPAGATPAGAFDMAGNVFEWTASPYCPYGGPRDCGDARRVIRGGAWNNLVPSFVRAADRSREEPGKRVDNVGFRCARSP